MKVLQHTAARLTIQENLFGIGLLSVATVCTGVFMFFLFEPPVDWIGAFCIGIGSLFRTWAPKETLTFDRDQQSLVICHHRLLGNKTRCYSILEVAAVEVNSVEMLGSRFYQVNLKMTSGRSLAVTHTISTDWQQQQKIVRHIRGFLNPPKQSAIINPLSTI
jgi:YD repeat-containing protein